MSKLLNALSTRRAAGAVETQVEELVVPLASVDGWTLRGTRLQDRVPFRMQRELCALLHGVEIGATTPYTYARAAELLDSIGEPGQAYAVCEAWFRLPAGRRAQQAQADRSLARQRNRLRLRVASAVGTI
ncbi:MAG: hypothetical protein M3P96_11810 [Actinomycetota bacterium]|nr:hypothetical protein [Actinomycetota bacterium]